MICMALLHHVLAQLGHLLASLCMFLFTPILQRGRGLSVCKPVHRAHFCAFCQPLLESSSLDELAGLHSKHSELAGRDR